MNARKGPVVQVFKMACPTCTGTTCQAWRFDDGFAIIVAREGDTIAGKYTTRTDVANLFANNYGRGTMVRSHLPGFAVAAITSTTLTDIGGKMALVAFCSAAQTADQLPTSSSRLGQLRGVDGALDDMEDDEALFPSTPSPGPTSEPPKAA